MPLYSQILDQSQQIIDCQPSDESCSLYVLLMPTMASIRVPNDMVFKCSDEKCKAIENNCCVLQAKDYYNASGMMPEGNKISEALDKCSLVLTQIIILLLSPLVLIFSAPAFLFLRALTEAAASLSIKTSRKMPAQMHKQLLPIP